MESASSVSLLIKLSVACCEEARGALTIPKCSRHASQALTPELQVATEDWRLKKCFTGITGRVPRLKLRSRIWENGDREHGNSSRISAKRCEFAIPSGKCPNNFRSRRCYALLCWTSLSAFAEQLAVVIAMFFPSPCKREGNKIAKCRRRKRRRYRRDGLLNRISSKGWEHRATSGSQARLQKGAEGFSRHMGIKRSRRTPSKCS